MIDKLVEIKPPFDLSAKKLRETGRVAGKRPEINIDRNFKLSLHQPDITKAPNGPVDVILVLGMGPVEDYFIEGLAGREVRIGPEHARMRQNSLAGLELAALGGIKKEGLIITSGSATADPKLFETALERKDEIKASLTKKDGTDVKVDEVKDERKARSLPESTEEIAKVDNTTEAELMAKLILRAQAKGGEKLTGEKLGVEVFADHKATETLDNFIYALNELDDRALKNGGALFNGTMAAVTTRYHIARTMETAYFLGIGDSVVPIVAQEALLEFGYGKQLDKLGNPVGIYDAATKKYDESTRWNEQRWIRALYQIPEYSLPKLVEIKSDERLIATLKHIKGIFGEEVFKKFELSDLNIENVGQLRLKLEAITRKNPVEEDWMKTDESAVNTTIRNDVMFTRQWINRNLKPDQSPN